MVPQQPLATMVMWMAGIGLLTSFFPWIFTYQGTLFGRPLSIRSLGDVLGIALVMIGAAAFWSNSLREKGKRIAAQLEELSPNEFRRLLVGGAVLFAAGAVSHKLRAHFMLSTHAFDLGFFSNICWNLSVGEGFFSSLLERDFLGIHANWILWPLSFFYWCGTDARMLLIAQVIFMSAAVPLIGLVMKEVTRSATASLIGALMFLCSPYFQHTVFNDFHPDTWQLPLLTLALWAFFKKRPAVLLFSSLLAILAKEDVSVVLCGFSIFLLLQRGWRAAGLALLGSSLFFFFTQVGYLIPKLIDNQSSSLLLSRYGHLGCGFKEIAINLLTKPAVLFHAIFFEPTKYWRMICMVFPAAGLTLFAPIFLIPPFVSLLPHLLSNASTQLSLADIYAVPTQPFVFVGAAVGFSWLMKKETMHGQKARLACAALIVAGIGVLNSPRTFRTLSPDRLAAFRELKALVPRDASLAAQQNLLPQFDTRRFIQLFPIGNSMPGLQKYVLVNPRYIVCDRIGNALPYDGPRLKNAIAKLESHAAYEKIFERENFLVFRRLIQEDPRWIVPSSDGNDPTAQF